MTSSRDTLPTPQILPFPKKLEWCDGFLGWEKASFDIDENGAVASAFARNIMPSSNVSERGGYILEVSGRGIAVEACDAEGLRNAAQTLRQIAMQSDERGIRFVKIRDFPDLRTRAFMLDISRCKVPTLSQLALLADMLGLFKYNRLELYTEHTYAFKGHELVWQDASPITPSDIEFLEKICRRSGLELVPNLNGLGHMERWLRYPEYAHLAESKAPFVDPLGTVRKYPTTLYPCRESVEFMRSLYADYLPHFSSKNVSIGGDEPWELGMGRSAERCRTEGKYAVYLKHMSSLADAAQKLGKRAHFWADVIMQKPEYTKFLPENMVPVIWGYYLDHPYESQCQTVLETGRDFMTACGTSTWNSFGSRWDCAIKNIEISTSCAKKYRAAGSILTQWGDGGNHQPWCAMYPAIVHFGACAWGRTPSEDETCAALSKFVLCDSSGEFADALCQLGRVDKNLKLYCNYQKIFFAPSASEVENILRTASIDKAEIVRMENAACFALSLASHAKVSASGANICMDEVELACAMIVWACRRAAGDFEIKSADQRRQLKAIVAEYERVWLLRARLGGLAESSARIRNLSADLF